MSDQVVHRGQEHQLEQGSDTEKDNGVCRGGGRFQDPSLECLLFIALHRRDKTMNIFKLIFGGSLEGQLLNGLEPVARQLINSTRLGGKLPVYQVFQ